MQTNRPSKIRQARISDAAALAALVRELGYQTTTAEIKSRLNTLSPKSHHGVFVAELDSIVGWIHVALVQSLQIGSFAEIRGLIVAKSQRSAGIGTHLVAVAEKWAREKGCHRIRVRTNIVREEARMFYARLGFQSKKTQEVFDRVLKAG